VWRRVQSTKGLPAMPPAGPSCIFREGGGASRDVGTSRGLAARALHLR
jgi:hypothetical protein